MQGLPRQEIYILIKCLKNNKSAGEDCIQCEILKMLNNKTMTKINKLIELIWEKETLTESWNVAVICPIHKKDDQQICKNYIDIPY